LRVLFSFLLAFVLWSGFAVAAEPQFPQLTGRVVDQANLLPANMRADIERKLADLETKTGTQLVVVTLNSLQGIEIEDYGYRLGRAWGIGQKGKNNGALLIIAPNEHRVRIEVGYGLEGTVTDAISRLIIENGVLPRFRVNDFAGGIQRGVDDLIQVLSGDAQEFQQRAVARDRGAARPQDLQGLIWIVLIVGFWLFLAFRSRRNRQGYRRGGMPWIVPVPMGGGWRGGGFGGGGWGGSGGGGFSGGGGSFGGGGASGRW
jgi:uncharacterized protein